MRRREFIAGLSGAAVWPLAARAQQSGGVRRVGVLINSVATDTEFQSYMAVFIRGLRQFGWVEGQNLRVDVRWNAGNAGLSQTYAAQLIGLMPDVILVASTTNLTAIRQVTSTVPVVFVSVSDPLAQGFVASVRQPGRNITGFSRYEFSIGGKWLGLLKEVAPGLARVAVMFNPDTSPQLKFFMHAIEAAAPSLGLKVIAAPVRAPADIEPALESFGRQPNGGLDRGETALHLSFKIGEAAPDGREDAVERRLGLLRPVLRGHMPGVYHVGRLGHGCADRALPKRQRKKAAPR